MYAETFNVRPWLETPAKWLRWAMQSLQASNTTDARYNLQQFWTTLATAKGQAQAQQDWSEILTLDAQSQWTLGNLYQADASDVLKQINADSSVNNLMNYANPLISVSDPVMVALKSKMDGLNKSAATAFAAQVQLAAQAKAAAASAGVQSQAATTLHVGQNAQTAAANDAAVMNREAQVFSTPTNPLTDLKSALTSSLLGLPLWAWLAGGAAVLLLVTTAPAMAQANALRRAVED